MKDAAPHIPEVVIRRLPIYSRALDHLTGEGVPVISSHDLGQRLGVTPAQIRKDLSYFGEFGKQGTGYDVELLRREIRAILGLNHQWKMALVGVGRLGRAIASYPDFLAQSFQVAALFDADSSKVGQEMAGLIVQPMSAIRTVVRNEGITIAIVAVPAAVGQRVVDELVECGITGVLNYAPISVTAPPHVRVRDVDPVVALQSMTYYLKDPDSNQQDSTNHVRARSEPIT